MRVLHVALVHLPPLVADLLRQSVLSKIPVVIKAVIDKDAKPDASLRDVDAIIVGQSSMRADWADFFPDNVPTLIVSSDLTSLSVSNSDDRVSFTAETLINALQRIADDLDPPSPPFPDPMIDS
jgi:hypothetical protein